MSEGSLTAPGFAYRGVFARSEGMIEAGIGLAVVVLAILGLGGLSPSLLAAIATIVVGFALIMLGAVVLGRYFSLLGAEADSDSVAEGGGVAISLLGGVAVAVLGLLALLDVQRVTLVAVAVIAVGAVLILGSTVAARLDRLQPDGAASSGDPILRLVATVTSSAQALVGFAGVVLGILALIIAPAATLELVALLAFGAIVVVSSPYAVSKAIELVDL